MINREEFDKTCYDLEHGVPLNCIMLGRIFGEDFWALLVICMSGAKEAASIFDQLVEAAKEKADK